LPSQFLLPGSWLVACLLSLNPMALTSRPSVSDTHCCPVIITSFCFLPPHHGFN
jgi:hypothetical protein